MEPGIFDLVYESFWDLYTFHHQLGDVSAKKMLTTWLPKIKLQVNEMTGVPEQPGAPVVDGEEPTEANEPSGGSPPYDPISAVVRVKIAKRIPDPVEDEEGNMV